jgi:hypothetical protein
MKHPVHTYEGFVPAISEQGLTKCMMSFALRLYISAEELLLETVHLSGMLFVSVIVSFALRLYIVILYFVYLSNCKIPLDQFNTGEVNESDSRRYGASVGIIELHPYESLNNS